MSNDISKKKCTDKKPKERRFYDLYKKDQSDEVTKSLAFYFAERAGLFADELKKLVLFDDIPALLDFNIDYSSLSVSHTRDIQFARQVLSLYSKNADLELAGVDKRVNCMNSFIETELKCKAVNERLFNLYDCKQNLFTEKSDFTDLLRKIGHILGDCPTLASLEFEFGPGSSVAVTGDETTPRFKLEAKPECSKSLFHSNYYWDMEFELPLYWLNHLDSVTSPDLVNGRFGMVPKNAKTLRTTVTEPTLNMPPQKGVGKRIRSRLLLFGLDLSSQAKNQELALLGSNTGEVVTVDVKNASNTISILAVFLLLYFADGWFEMLNTLRSSHVTIDGAQYALESFSSMGNGFTFELESLIFYAIALTVTEKVGADISKVNVYGDDIIVPTEAYNELRVALDFFGFTINSEKSFIEGPFRESCGKDYFFGQNVRPFYCKDRWTDARIVGFLNHDSQHYNLLDNEARLLLLSEMNPNNILFGPAGYGDGHVILPSEELELNLYVSDTPILKRSKQTPQKSRRLEHLEKRLTADPFLLKRTVIRNEKPEYVLKESDRSLLKRHSKSGYTFTSFTKTPKTSGISCEKGDMLIPFYNIYRKGSLVPVFKDLLHTEIVCLPDSFQVINSGFESVITGFTDTTMTPDLFGIENDPFVVKNGWKAQRTNIYTLSICPSGLDSYNSFTVVPLRHLTTRS